MYANFHSETVYLLKMAFRMVKTMSLGTYPEAKDTYVFLNRTRDHLKVMEKAMEITSNEITFISVLDFSTKTTNVHSIYLGDMEVEQYLIQLGYNLDNIHYLVQNNLNIKFHGTNNL